jgi:hypothetical protein
LLAVALLQFKPQHATIEFERALQIRNLQMHVPDPHAGVNGTVRLMFGPT